MSIRSSQKLFWDQTKSDHESMTHQFIFNWKTSTVQCSKGKESCTFILAKIYFVTRMGRVEITMEEQGLPWRKFTVVSEGLS